MRDYLLQGGFYSGLVESEVRVDSRVHGLTGGLRFHKAQGRFKYIVHLFTRPAWVAEAGTRIHQYQQALAEGANRYDAIRAARMVSSDFCQYRRIPQVANVCPYSPVHERGYSGA